MLVTVHIVVLNNIFRCPVSFFMIESVTAQGRYLDNGRASR